MQGCCHWASPEQLHPSQFLVSTLGWCPHPPQCKAPQEGNAAMDGKILLVEPRLLVESVVFSQTHCSTGCHVMWRERGHILKEVFCLWWLAWSVWCFLMLVITLFMKYFKKNQCMSEETKIRTAYILCSRMLNQDRWYYNFRTVLPTLRLGSSQPHPIIISCRTESKEDINSKW